jgi:hypothetical protein
MKRVSGDSPEVRHPLCILLTFLRFSRRLMPPMRPPCRELQRPCLAVDDSSATKSGPRSARRNASSATSRAETRRTARFILQDPARDTDPEQRSSLAHNRAAFARMASIKKGDESRRSAEVTGGLNHGGEDVLKRDSTGYKILEEFVRRLSARQRNPRS